MPQHSGEQLMRMMAAALGVALPLVMVLSGCGAAEDSSDAPPRAGRGPAAAASASTGAGQAALIEFAQCMRSHGMTWFPDPPKAGGAQDIDLPAGVTQADFEAAQKACGEAAKDIVKGPSTGTADTAGLEMLKQYSKCMRENGVPDFPDPSADGSLVIDDDDASVKTSSSTFKAAQQTCAQYQPGSGPGGR